jgi:hypothetical protein
VIGKTVVIGIGYKARRGKDTAAKPLVKGLPSLCAPLCLRRRHQGRDRHRGIQTLHPQLPRHGSSEGV